MVTSFPEQLLSPQFTFFIGEKRTPVSIHAGVMANLSKPFDRLINGSMKEAQEKCAVFYHVELDIFLRLVEFAYTEDYTIRPCANDDLEGNKQDCEDLDQDEKIWEAAWDKAHKTKLCLDAEAPERELLEFHWHNRVYLPQTSKSPITSRAKAARLSAYKFHTSSRDHKPVYLVHAKLYSFALGYLVPGLKDLALHKMHELLKLCLAKDCLLSPDRVPDIVTLLSYVYSNENTPDRNAGGHTDEMRQEVLEFVVLHLNQLEGEPDFDKLLEEGGQLPVDLISFMAKLRRAETEELGQLLFKQSLSRQ